MPNLYIIAGCNGAGKTTASYTVLPEMLECDEFINADEIAKGLSPFNPEKAAIESGRIMLDKISKLISQKVDFAFETTLATRSYINTIQKAKSFGYDITLVFFWLDSVELAIERVKIRVEEGGHNIPVNVIKRRYLAGLKNLFQLYMSESSYWMIFNNSSLSAELIAEGYNNYKINIQNKRTFEIIKKISQDDSRK
jgi:predicted ABC-type ATPase